MSSRDGFYMVGKRSSRKRLGKKKAFALLNTRGPLKTTLGVLWKQPKQKNYAVNVTEESRANPG